MLGKTFVARRYKTSLGNIVYKTLDNSFLARFSKKNGRYMCNLVIVPANGGTDADVRNKVRALENSLNRQSNGK